MNSKRSTVLTLVLGGLALVLIAIVIGLFLEAGLRHYVVGKINDTLQGYTVQIEGLYFRPLSTFGVLGVVVVQDAFPDQPVARIGGVTIGIHWRDILAGRVVADLHVQEPVLRISVAQLSTELDDQVPFEERGWKELEDLYPFEINAFRVTDGVVTYTEERFPPVELSRINLEAENIRNVRRADEPYPSAIQMEAVVFERGSVVVNGRGNLLASPHPAFRGEVTLRDLNLGYLEPLAKRYQITLREGTLEAGEIRVEYAPHRYLVEVSQAVIRGLEGDYIYTDKGDAPPIPTGEAAKEQTQIRLGSVSVLDSRLGLVNITESPDYRVFMEVDELHMENFGTEDPGSTGTVRMRGAFMGEGHSILYATVGQNNEEGPDFQISLAVENTPLARLSEAAKAHAGLTVAEGTFSLYAEVAVQGGRIEGYVKPMFRDVKIGDEDADRDWLQRIYEGVADAVVGLLENRRDEVVAVTDLSGPVEEPEADTWQAITSLLRNAFYRAILPGFEDKFA